MELSGKSDFSEMVIVLIQFRKGNRLYSIKMGDQGLIWNIIILTTWLMIFRLLF